jgi:hypothetical protein
MSHFTVLVIGPDPEAQLAPFHEYECTGVNDQWVVDVDQTDEVKSRLVGEEPETLADALGYYGIGVDNIVDDEAKIDRKSEAHRWHWAVVKDGVLIKAVDRTNPNKQWDWYVLGGRWAGMLHTKTGKQVDQALMKDIDWRGMRDAAAAKARARHEEGNRILSGFEEPLSWEAVRAQFGVDPATGAGRLDEARKFMQEQPAYKWAHTREELRWAAFDGNLEEFWWPVAKWEDRARRKAVMTFAVIKDGQWHQKGNMGWWGMVSDEKDPTEWENEYAKLIESLSPETLLSVYDCHI